FSGHISSIIDPLWRSEYCHGGSNGYSPYPLQRASDYDNGLAAVVFPMLQWSPDNH
ncbi:hypothetical protein HAX54_044196, partial [Datura stramonium]|nr:hypothetical protein [Datura stramonium]